MKNDVPTTPSEPNSEQSSTVTNDMTKTQTGNVSERTALNTQPGDVQLTDADVAAAAAAKLLQSSHLSLGSQTSTENTRNLSTSASDKGKVNVPPAADNTGTVATTKQPVAQPVERPVEGKQPPAATSTDGKTVVADAGANRGIVTTPDAQIKQNPITTTPGDGAITPVPRVEPKGSEVKATEVKSGEVKAPDVTGGSRSVMDAVSGSRNTTAAVTDGQTTPVKSVQNQPTLANSTIDRDAGAQQTVAGRLANQAVREPVGGINTAPQVKSEGVSVEGSRRESPGLKGNTGDAALTTAGLAQPNSSQVKGDFINTRGFADSNQGGLAAGVKPEGLKTPDGKIDLGKAAEPVAGAQSRGLSDIPGVRGEQLGGRTDQAGMRGDQPGLRGEQAGLRGEQAGSRNDIGSKIDQLTGGKSDSSTSTQKADQMVRGIESRVNEGVKQPGIESGGKAQGTTDGVGAGTRQPSTETGASGIGRQPGTTDGATTAGRQPGMNESGNAGIRQPVLDGDGKGSSGGGSTIAGESTKKIDVGMPSGGKSEGQGGNSGMGGGSSAPIDRAPHKPFSVEEAGGKGSLSDASGVKGSAGAGPRFDTGEVRTADVGQRFDSPELRGGKSGGGTAPGLSDSGLKGVDQGIGKGADGTTKGGVSGSGASGGVGSGVGASAGDGGLLGDKRQPPAIPDNLINQTGKAGKLGDGIPNIVGKGDEAVPLVLPGSFGPREGGRRQSDQIFGDKGKANDLGGKPDVKTDSNLQGPYAAQRTDGPGPSGQRGANTGTDGPKGEGPGGQSGQKGDKSGPKGDVGPTGSKGVPGVDGNPSSGVADVGGVLRNFAQSVLSDVKTGGKSADSAPILGDADDPTKPSRANDFSGPGQKTSLLGDTRLPADIKLAGESKGEKGDKGEIVPGAKSPGSSAGKDSAKKGGGFKSGPIAEFLGSEAGDNEEQSLPVEEFELPQVDLLGEVNELSEIEEVNESPETQVEDQMQYELALGLQLYTSIAQAPYGAYYYCSKDGDTVESVAREVVGDVRTSPLVFSLNKEHILASTEYGVHPFKTGAMIQLPTPRDLKEFFGKQA